MGISKTSKTKLGTSPFGLALSGGGYRATLFHLGALRRLNEIGWLSKLDRITSVSGGSLLLGYLLCRTPDVLNRKTGIAPADWTKEVSEPVHRFVQNDLRTGQVIKNFTVNFVFNRDKRLNSSIKRLTKLYGDKKLQDFKHTGAKGKWPEIYIIATDIVHGQAFKFSNKDKASGHSKIGSTTLGDFPIAKACMVSACFPPIFGPFFPGFKPSIFIKSPKAKNDEEKKNDAEKIRKLALVDGGLYDNLGANLIIGGSDKFIRLFSDAGSPLGITHKGTKSVKVVGKYLKLMSAFIGRLNIQRVQAIQKNSYAFWSSQYYIKGAGQNGLGFDKNLVEYYLEDVRTDLDYFSTAEAKIIENHGYAQAELALQDEFGAAYKALELPAAAWPYPEPEFTDGASIKPVLVKARKGKYLSQLFKLKLVDPA